MKGKKKKCDVAHSAKYTFFQKYLATSNILPLNESIKIY